MSCILCQNHFREVTKLFVGGKQLVDVTEMVRNAGQLPQPFWLGAARGSSQNPVASCIARA